MRRDFTINSLFYNINSGQVGRGGGREGLTGGCGVKVNSLFYNINSGQVGRLIRPLGRGDWEGGYSATVGRRGSWPGGGGWETPLTASAPHAPA